MYHETIPESIFQRSWDVWKSSQRDLERCPDILQHVWTEGTQARFRRALSVLVDHSIIEYEPSKGLCTMHPVVHTWARERLPATEQRRWLRCKTAILAYCISPYLEASGRHFRGLLVPHIRSCLQLYDSQDLSRFLTLDTASKLERFAWVFAEQGHWKVARGLLLNIVTIREAKLGKQHDNTIRAKLSLGQTYWNLFEVKDAIMFQRAVLDSLRWHRPRLSDWAIWPLWAPIHLPYCIALNEITPSLWLAGQRLWSKRTGKRAVDGLTIHIGREDPLTLKAMFNLGRTYLHLGEEEKSRELLVWVLRRQKRYFGMNHPDTLMTRNELGILLCASKKHLNAAQRLVENVLQTRKKIMGEEHAYTLWSVNDLSKIYVEVGRTDDAFRILENIAPIVKRTLGDDHVGMLLTKSNLARAYYLAGNWTEAEETVRPLLAKLQNDHPDWFHNMYGYAHILFKLGRIDEAERYGTQVMDRVMRTKIFELSHPRTTSIAELLIMIYRHQGRDEMVAAVQKQVPKAGLSVEQGRFDPYAVRRASEQSSQTTPKAETPTERTQVQLTAPAAGQNSASHNTRSQNPTLRLVNSRTF
ncbi:TPR-like protein [Setomelanomma holmii]|uniref:TPR-like protein n=1 Tax=Setomelanomma holmii TaxID=210430 RepID=A0A9P4LGY2_9PLEO|nr:TPR-like protein [Setomelanomma holmii]